MLAPVGQTAVMEAQAILQSEEPDRVRLRVNLVKAAVRCTAEVAAAGAVAYGVQPSIGAVLVALAVEERVKLMVKWVLRALTI